MNRFRSWKYVYLGKVEGNSVYFWVKNKRPETVIQIPESGSFHVEDYLPYAKLPFSLIHTLRTYTQILYCTYEYVDPQACVCMCVCIKLSQIIPS